MTGGADGVVRQWLMRYSGLLVALLASCPFATASRPLNCVLILCDNLGYGDIEVYHPRALQGTPRLKQLAREGMAFTHAYTAAPVCTPARAALMTDPSEELDQYQQRPDIVTRLIALAEEARRDLGEMQERGNCVRPYAAHQN